MTHADLFDEHLTSWRAWQESPWGRIRYRVVAETLRHTCASLGGDDRMLQVLDVGGGDGRDSLPLLASGHRVTLVDPSPGLRHQAQEAAAAAGHGDRLTVLAGTADDVTHLRLDPADLVLCHHVVQYVDDTDQLVAALAAALAVGGAVSVMAPNPASDVLTAVVRRGDLAEATRMLDASHATAATFGGHAVRRVSADEVSRSLRRHGLSDLRTYGVRCVTDYLTDDEAKRDPDVYARLEALELALHDRAEFVGAARMWQLVARRPGAA